MLTKGKGKRRFPAVNLIPAKRPKPLEVAFHLLPKQYEKTPKEPDQIVHLQAGLGRSYVRHISCQSCLSSIGGCNWRLAALQSR
ncbi:hypothetical protein FQN60_009114, partial [Etheostoma spectabile]